MSLIKQNTYRPNLPDLMQLCDRNYLLALQLLADKEIKGEQRHFFISDLLSYTISIDEVTRYTSLITIAQNTETNVPALVNLLRPTMLIRLYHDARVAEVISSQHVRQVKPRYDYPNNAMHQPDEKQQINQFLKEWLQLCLQQGQVNVKLPFE